MNHIHHFNSTIDRSTLRGVNLIVFPDWSKPEEDIIQELEKILLGIVNHSEQHYITLLIYIEDISEESAELLVSSAIMNIFLQENQEIQEVPDLFVIGEMNQEFWNSLIPRMHYRLPLENENNLAIQKLEAFDVAIYPIKNFNKISRLIDSYGIVKNSLEGIAGYLEHNEAEFLFRKVKSLSEDAIIVEIGSYHGKSTIAMAYGCLGTNRTIYCIDVWQYWSKHFSISYMSFFDVWNYNISNHGFQDRVVPLRGFSHWMLRHFKQKVENRGIDLIFIDASHEYSDVLIEFQLAFPLLKPGGWMLFHDVTTFSGPEQVWHENAKHQLLNHEYCGSIACGQKAFK